MFEINSDFCLSSSHNGLDFATTLQSIKNRAFIVMLLKAPPCLHFLVLTPGGWGLGTVRFSSTRQGGGVLQAPTHRSRPMVLGKGLTKLWSLFIPTHGAGQLLSNPLTSL